MPDVLNQRHFHGPTANGLPLREPEKACLQCLCSEQGIARGWMEHTHLRSSGRLCGDPQQSMALETEVAVVIMIGFAGFWLD